MSLFAAMSDDNSVWAKGSSLFNISSPLNDLLEKDDFTLEQVLQEDELIQEVKTRNSKLLEFLSQEESVQKMIEYVVRTPEAGSDDMRTLKYPYMSCEVICCDIMSITETLATALDGKIVETMFEFLYQPAPLDPRLAGYFEKIMSMLMVRKPQEMTALMNRNTDKLLKGFIQHAQSFSIAELLKRLLQPYHCDYMDDCMDFPGMSVGFPTPGWYATGDDDGEVSVGTPTAQKSLSWQQDTTVVDLLIQNLAATNVDGQPQDTDVQKHSAEVLVDIIHCGTRAQQNDPASPRSMSSQVPFVLLEYLESKEVVENIIELAIPSTNAAFSTSSMTSALSVLSALLARHTNPRYSSNDDMPSAVACTIERLPQLCATLRGEDHEPGTIRNQRHQEVPRLGLRRLKLVGLVVLLVQSKYHQVDAAITNEDVIAICLDLFFKFDSVNMLHADVENMIIGILESGGPDLLVGLIKKGKLLERILDGHEKNKQAMAEPKGTSLGYMGHLHRICNMIISLQDDVRGGGSADGRTSLNDMTHADSVLEMLEEDKASWAKWEELSTKTLAPIYERERLPLGGVTVSGGAEDPYSMMGFHQNDDLLNAQFAHMLSGSGFSADPSDERSAGFDTDFDIKGSNDTPMLPEIMNDSSSSSEEDEEEHEERRHHIDMDDDDDFDFDPRAESGSSVPYPDDATAAQQIMDANNANWANFEEAATATWANFEQTTTTTTTTTEESFTANFDGFEVASSSTTTTTTVTTEITVAELTDKAEAEETKQESETAVETTAELASTEQSE